MRSSTYWIRGTVSIRYLSDVVAFTFRRRRYSES